MTSSIQDTINSNRAAQGSQEINDVITRWQTYPNSQDASTIYNYIKPAIDSALRSYAQGDTSLRVPAYRLAFDAVKTFNKSKGTDVKTHIFHNLQRLNRLKAERSSIVHIPEGVAKDYTTVSKAISDFQDKYDREPTDDELADITSLAVKRINKILSGTNPISSSQGVADTGADLVTHRGISDDTYVDYLYKSSDKIDQKIIEDASGYHGRPILPNLKIAQKLHITPAAVSMRMNNLRKRMTELKEML